MVHQMTTEDTRELGGRRGGRARVEKTAGGENRGAGAMAGGMELTALVDWAL